MKSRTPPHVRKTYQTICASKQTGRSNGPSTNNSPVVSLSRQIDTQRRLVLDLEREIHWLNSEKGSLRQQIGDIDRSIETLMGTTDQTRSSKLKLSQLTDGINTLCWNWMYPSVDSKDNANQTLERLRIIDPRISFPVQDSSGVVCACVVDAPNDGLSLESYMRKIEKAVDEILSFSAPSVRIVHAEIDSEEPDALKVFFSVPRESGNILAREVERLSENSEAEVSTLVKQLLEVTRKLIIDTQPSLEMIKKGEGHSLPQKVAPYPASGNDSNSLSPKEAGARKQRGSPKPRSPPSPLTGPVDLGVDGFIPSKELPLEQVAEVTDGDDSSSQSEKSEIGKKPSRGSVRKAESPRSSARSWRRRIARGSVRADRSQSPKRDSVSSTMSKARSKWGKSATAKMGVPPSIPEPE